jgi:hypothetical protein
MKISIDDAHQHLFVYGDGALMMSVIVSDDPGSLSGLYVSEKLDSYGITRCLELMLEHDRHREVEYVLERL